MAGNSKFFFEVATHVGDGFYGEGIIHSKSIIVLFGVFVKSSKEKSFLDEKIVDILCFLYYNIKRQSVEEGAIWRRYEEE